jgi:carboxypeptidase T
MPRLALTLALLLPAAVAAQPAPRYSEVRIRLAGEGALARLAALGVGLDEHADLVRDGRGLVLTTVVNAAERARLARGPFPVEVLVDDVAAAFAARPRLSAAEVAALDAANPLRGFDFGSMAGFYTFAEMAAELDSMAALYPHLAAEKVSLGQTGEGRDVWMLKISDNPGLDEGEPEALYTAVHHAREPQSMMTVLYFMYHLLENYGTDPEVTALVDSRALYFVPMVNPDGYVYNETTNPEGGGMWRKNRRVTAPGDTAGVDLNRNYGHLWGLDDEGSSPWTWAETYRGSAPFSEPEIAAVRDFVEGRRFVTAVNFHSRGELYLFPWGYADDTFTPDDALFRGVSADMAAENGYTYGTGPQVLYATNGDAVDWMYGEQTTKPKILAWTAEVCNRSDEGFWPPIDRIIPVAQANLRANLALARLAGTVVAGEPAPEAAADALALAPNPATSTVRLAFDQPAGPATVEVHDALGRRVLHAVLPAAPAGRRAHTLDVSALAPGRYLVGVTDAAGRRLARPLTRAR